MIFMRRKPEPIPYDRASQQPAVRRSICTGEMTVGFVKGGVFQRRGGAGDLLPAYRGGDSGSKNNLLS